MIIKMPRISMKPITSFILSKKLGYVMDIDDGPEAVIVCPSTGGVIINRGPENLLNYGAVEGTEIHEFWIDRINGESVVGFTFQRGNRVERHALGCPDDQLSAEAWVERVNKLYRNNHSLRGKQDRTLTQKFRDNPVIHDILETGVNRVLPGDYLRSSEQFPVPDFRPFWQKFYVKRAIHYLCETTGTSPARIKEEWLNPPEHRYPYLADRIKYGKHNFDHRVTQPLEFIFDCDPRKDKIGIIRLAEVLDFAILWLKGTAVETEMNPPSEDKRHVSIEAWLARFADAQKKLTRKILICTPADTVVDYLMNDLILHGNDQLIGQKASMPSISSLGDWLIRFQGIVACDIGVAFQIENYIQRETGAGFGIAYSFVPYDVPIPAGIAYRVDDPLWSQICVRAIDDCLNSQIKRVLKSVKDTAERVRLLGMKWLRAA